ncbi:YczE/YyaS/YitT family protein [Pontiella agarivorans]|uniref:DUF6198 family protein n=1 Tax=Pontiella agarivorans TaxID=3038953 RepID=A0ABU5MZ98_9BACT|nr:DUF6198 family protein [Pontiella agarivorans]MDZ8119503.1 DUF6198 family protein [Pontiella agarivorans]
MYSMKLSTLVKKIALFMTGLFIMAVAVALSIKADLGVSPISCVPYVYSLKTSLSVGQLTILLNILLMVLQVILLRRNYRIIQLIQLPAVMVFGMFIDLALLLLADLPVSSYGLRAFWCMLSCAVLGFGVFLEVKSDLTYLPGEGFVAAVVEKFEHEFGKVKIGVDSALVLVGLLSSFVLLHQLKGIREGTLAAALLVGLFVKFYSRKLSVVDGWLSGGVAAATVPVSVQRDES